MAKLRTTRLDATMDNVDEAEMETANKTANEKQMAVAFLLGGGKYFDSFGIKL